MQSQKTNKIIPLYDKYIKKISITEITTSNRLYK